MLLCTCLLPLTKSVAQQAFSTTDSIRTRIQVTILQSDFNKAGAVYELEKYQLGNDWKTNPDSLFYQTFGKYEIIFNSLPEAKRGLFFRPEFYDLAFSIAQYFRDPRPVVVLTQHREQLHPSLPGPDPKHGHAHEGEGHTHE